jgi:hypothetical protein
MRLHEAPMPDRPSLFALATSELSQDAFLGWLLSWAHPSFQDVDAALHRAGRRFLEDLARKVGWLDLASDLDVAVHLQLDRIDVLVKVGADRALVIEDKVDANELGNDLDAYLERAARRLAIPRERVKGVYLKTGDQSDISKAVRAGFVHYDRERLLAVLNAAVADGATNDILDDYLRSLSQRERDTAAWRSVPVAQWQGAAHALFWRGFFSALQAELGVGNWGFVNNAGGGVYAFWWAGRRVDGGWLYLQADSRVRLAARVWIAEGHDRTDVRRRWQAHATSVPATASVRFAAPPSPRSGQSAEVARFALPWVVANTDGTLDLGATIAALRAAMTWLDEVAPPAP